jgi:hypothetical protein
VRVRVRVRVRVPVKFLCGVGCVLLDHPGQLLHFLPREGGREGRGEREREREADSDVTVGGGCDTNRPSVLVR